MEGISEELSDSLDARPLNTNNCSGGEARGIEPLTPCLQSRCSPAELHPHVMRADWKQNWLKALGITCSIIHP